VIFSRATNPGGSGYAVNVLSDQTVDRLSVRQGKVTLAMNGHTLATSNSGEAGLAVGEFGGAPILTIQNGRLNLAGPLLVGAAGRLELAAGGNSVLRTSALNISGVVDLNDNRLIVDYDGGSPIASVRSLIQTGALTSTRAATSPNPGEVAATALGYGEAGSLGITSFGGFSVDATSIVVKYTYVGDASLDGKVDIADLGMLASNWQSAGFWTEGDFDYSGFVNVADLGLLASNWQAGVGNPLGPGSLGAALVQLGLPSVSVPEPATPVTAAVLLVVSGSRRRRVNVSGS
jgi:hypothetical protein